MKALIVYYTKTGHTLDAANDIARGLEGEGVECNVKAAGEIGTSGRALVEDYDIIIFGTPTYGNRRYRLAARPVQTLVDSLAPRGLEGKTAGAFAVNAGVGAARLVEAMEKQLADSGARVVTGGPAVKAGAPLSLWKGPDASRADVEKCVEFGRRVAFTARKG